MKIECHKCSAIVPSASALHNLKSLDTAHDRCCRCSKHMTATTGSRMASKKKSSPLGCSQTQVPASTPSIQTCQLTRLPPMSGAALSLQIACVSSSLCLWPSTDAGLLAFGICQHVCTALIGSDCSHIPVSSRSTFAASSLRKDFLLAMLARPSAH